MELVRRENSFVVDAIRAVVQLMLAIEQIRRESIMIRLLLIIYKIRKYHIFEHSTRPLLSFRSILLSGRARSGEERGSIKWTYGTVVERGTGYGDRGERGRGGLRASCGLDVACDCGIRGCGCCCGGGARAVHVNRAR